MTNTKSRKTGKVSKEGLPNGNNNIDVAGAPQIELHASDPDWLPNRIDVYGYGVPEADQDSEDGDDDGCNDGATSTSFSLQECMDEFRARRVRRVSSHSRHEFEKGVMVDNYYDATERDLINQNMCNKEHERKCKPCKDGFCYCFASDSGDCSAGIPGQTKCGGTRSHVRHSRRLKSSECGQATDGNRQHSKKLAKGGASENMVHPQGQKSIKVSTKNNGQLTAISRLETSHRDAPLIQIIQELRDNCVISEVRVNKHKLQVDHPIQNSNQDGKNSVSMKGNFTVPTPSRKANSTQRRYLLHKTPLEPHTPSAPVLENSLELDSKHVHSLDSSSLDNNNKCHDKANRHNKVGGRLLQKRLSNSNFRFKPRDIIDPPRKPPRSSLSFEEKSSISNSSTSPSVREAERILNDFLARRGYKASTENTFQKSHIISPKHKEKRNSFPLGKC